MEVLDPIRGSKEWQNVFHPIIVTEPSAQLWRFQLQSPLHTHRQRKQPVQQHERIGIACAMDYHMHKLWHLNWQSARWQIVFASAKYNGFKIEICQLRHLTEDINKFRGTNRLVAVEMGDATEEPVGRNNVRTCEKL